MTEEIRDFYGYSVSNNGYIIGKNGKQLKGYIDKRGYVMVGIYKDGVNKLFTLHKIVATTFPEICGEWFEGCCIHHLDHNPQNNSAENLKVLSREEHSQIHSDSELTKAKQTEKIAKYDLGWNLIHIYNSVKECIEDNCIDKKTWCRYIKGDYGRSKYYYLKLDSI